MRGWIKKYEKRNYTDNLIKSVTTRVLCKVIFYVLFYQYNCNRVHIKKLETLPITTTYNINNKYTPFNQQIYSPTTVVITFDKQK